MIKVSFCDRLAQSISKFLVLMVAALHDASVCALSRTEKGEG
jgi:hypothetical protein